MSDRDDRRCVGLLDTKTGRADSNRAGRPRLLTRAMWLLFAGSLAVALVGAGVSGADSWNVGWESVGVVAVDGLTVLMWVVATFVSGLVHSFSRRYMAGTRGLDRFFGWMFGFTVAVMVLVAADHLVLFAAAWAAMGWAMSRLIGHVDGWRQAREAAGLARRYFAGSTVVLTAGLGVLGWATGAWSISGALGALEGASGGGAGAPVTAAAVLLLTAAMVQSALVPFHGWLLSSMTAPTPASALMHAGFVNAGGVLLARFAPVFVREAWPLLLVLSVGAVSALAGKLIKAVQPDVKRRLGCSTVGQMGFMIMQAGLGFFGAAVTHLILHGFYKAYSFLSAGSRVQRKAPTAGGEPGDDGAAATLVGAATALAGGAIFAWMTGKGAHFDSGLVLTALIVLTTFHAAREAVGRTDLPALTRYGAVGLVFLPAIALYALVYNLVVSALAGLPVLTAPVQLGLPHAVIAAAFVAIYVVIESGAFRRSERLYAHLLNAARPASRTLLTSKEEYRDC